MNAPKKIWFDIEECSAGPVQFSDDEIPYIREDLVDALVETLVEALKGIVRYAGNNGDDYLADQVRWALTKLEESHD